jgi:hypothetical protein
LKTVAHIFHDDESSLVTGSRLPARIAEEAALHGIEVEVFVFGPAQRRLTENRSDADGLFNAQIDALIASGVPVGACVNAAREAKTEASLLQRGLKLSVARDEFIRFTLEHATIVSF